MLIVDFFIGFFIYKKHICTFSISIYSKYADIMMSLVP